MYLGTTRRYSMNILYHYFLTEKTMCPPFFPLEFVRTVSPSSEETCLFITMTSQHDVRIYTSTDRFTINIELVFDQRATMLNYDRHRAAGVNDS